ncbi:hypothetical protein PT974_08151 [Cladobotryum mycophilum]|uniref:Uncharacterized protein n=1 Tax=Cladobotryum mycophilum TaxID=491253 RepID=A0ABR0SCK6_9HYPO
MSFAISRRDPGLADLSDEALEQLTYMLYMDSTMYFGDQARKWLINQENRIRGLDSSLLRPKGLLSRLAISMGKHKLPLCPARAANLCAAHKAMDPRIVRNLLLLIADECTIQTNRYRGLRLRQELPLSLDGWMERLDFLTALWVGENRYEGIFKRKLKTPVPECATSGCEACILAVIGGSAVYLTDLRASLLARQAYLQKPNRGNVREPRLLRIVESWVSFYEASCQRVVRFCSESIVGDIVDMRTKVRRRRDREVGRHLRRGRFPPPEGHLMIRMTEDGLPMPRQPRFRSGGGSARHRCRAARQDDMVEMSGALGLPAEEQDVKVQHVSDDNDDDLRGLGLVGFGSLSLSDDLMMDGEELPSIKNPFHDRAKEVKVEEVIEWEEEYWIQEYRDLVLRGDDFFDESGPFTATSTTPESVVHHSRSQLCINTQSDEFWTSRIEESESDVESPREITPPSSLHLDDSHIENQSNKFAIPPTPSSSPPPPPSRPLSSFYSQDGVAQTPTQREMGDRPLSQTISMLSTMQRGSAMPLPLDRAEIKGDHKAALAKLEGRESVAGGDNVASCYAAMGWGGPKR